MEEYELSGYLSGKQFNNLAQENFDLGYNLGKSIGEAKGAIIGFLGGIFLCVTLYGMNNFINYTITPKNQPQQTHQQPFTQSELPDKLNENHELRLK